MGQLLKLPHLPDSFMPTWSNQLIIEHLYYMNALEANVVIAFVHRWLLDKATLCLLVIRAAIS